MMGKYKYYALKDKSDSAYALMRMDKNNGEGKIISPTTILSPGKVEEISTEQIYGLQKKIEEKNRSLNKIHKKLYPEEEGVGHFNMKWPRDNY